MSGIMEKSRKKKQFTWYFWIGISISILFLYLSMRKVDWHVFLSAIRKANIVLLGFYVLGIGINFLLMSARWRILLTGVSNLSFSDTYDFFMVGTFVNFILPSRLGDVTRAMLVKYYTTTPFSKVLGSIVLEKMMDLGMLLVLALGMSRMVAFPVPVQTGITMITVIMILAVTIVLILAYTEDRLSGTLTWCFAFLPRMIANLVIGIILRFSQGLHAVRNLKQIVRALFLTVFVWIISGMAIISSVMAFHMPIPWYAGLFVMVLVNLGAILPSSPGAIGVYHYMAVLALSLWLPDKSMALGFAVVSHGVNMVLVIVLGSVSLVSKGLSLRSISSTNFGNK